MKLSIIIPCFNEEKTIEQVVNKVLKFKTLEKEILIIDDCSVDNSREIIKKISNLNTSVKCFFQDKNLGKGSAIRKGFEVATGDILLIDGATASQTGYLKSGDYLQVGAGATASLHKVLADVNSDSSGNVNIDIWPSIKTAPTDNSTVVLSSAKGLFRLISNETSWNITAASIYGITFGARQAL